MTPALFLFTWTVAGVVGLALLLQFLPKLGTVGRSLSDRCIRAPGLDVIVLTFTAAPQIIGVVFGVRCWGGWPGAAGGFGLGVAGQVVGLVLWTVGHELANPEARRGPRIVKFLNEHVGLIPNVLAVSWTTLAVPLFNLIRLAQYFVYPPLTWLVRLPGYEASEWINVSRQKFNGLVGYDLIWCLYCDWMTGVWSLGGEMLRNVESFWCPIRFRSPEKCANCKVDFPDIDNGWTPAEADMEAVVETLDRHFNGQAVHSWYGHPDRLSGEAETGRKVESADGP
jgi:type IV secretory pathway TrbD component